MMGMGKVEKMMKMKMFEVGLLLMIHGGMIKLAMMKMFLKLIMM
jgi:hypothetical protein